MTVTPMFRSLARPAVCGAKPSSAKAARLSTRVSPRSEPATRAPYTPLGSRFFARRWAAATDSNHGFAIVDLLVDPGPAGLAADRGRPLALSARLVVGRRRRPHRCRHRPVSGDEARESGGHLVERPVQVRPEGGRL